MIANLAGRNLIRVREHLAGLPAAPSGPEAPSQGADWILLGTAAAICVLGLICIFSATHLDDGAGLPNYHYLQRQGLGVVLGLGALGVSWWTDYRKILRQQWWIYAVNLLLLLAVLKLGHHEVKGAQRWIGIGSFRLQPSEFAKIAIILTLTAHLSSRESTIRKLPTLGASLIHVAIPALVIFKQPDLGTALVIFSIWLAAVFVAGARVRHLLALFLAGVLLFSMLWLAGGIKQYQKDRFSVFLHTSQDRQGVGYHVTQATDAIGSGKLWGKGLLHGSQGQLGYIPEQHTDFIFTIVGEELGFAGSVSLVLLYALFLWRAIAIALAADDTQGRLLATGVVAMFLYHVVVNIGMTIGIMPVTGVPLPFMSFGSSSMMTSLCAVGLLLSVRARQPRLAL